MNKIAKDPGFSALREKAGLSLEETAALVGCDLRTIYRYEARQTRPRKAVLRLLERTARERMSAREAGAAFDFVDLFAGIGGMRFAFESVGGRCVATCENNKYARQTYAANFPVADDPFYEDIRDITR